MASGQPQRNRFLVLDSFRGVCAVLVAAYHSSVNGHFLASGFGSNTYLLVDFFFVLSGFVMMHTYGNRIASWHDAGVFLARRAARLWPLHLAVLLGFVLLELLKSVLAVPGDGLENLPFSGPHAPGALLLNALLVHSWGILPFDSWNVPSWSISTEVLAYIVFAVVLVIARRVGDYVMLILCLGGMAVVAAWSANYMSTSYDYGIYRCFFGFFLGCLTFRYRSGLSWLTRSGAVAGMIAEMALAAAVIGFLCAAGPRSMATLASPFLFALAVGVFSFEGSAVSSFMKRRLFVLLGTISYSIYMIHYLVFAVMEKAASLAQKRLGMKLFATWTSHDGRQLTGLDFGSPGLMDLVTIAAVVVVVLVSWAAYRAIELPARTWMQNFLSERERARRRAVPGAAPPSMADSGAD